MYFKTREPEPQEMNALEHKAFGDLSEDNYKRWFIPLVDDALKGNIPDNAKILDVGSGPGFLSKELALRSEKFLITGIDISDDAISIAKNNCRTINNISFQKSSVYDLPFSDNSFDLVICKDSFHHFEDPNKALSEMWRVTKKNGLLYIQDLRRDVPMYLLKRSIPLENIIQKLQYYSVRASHTKEEVKKLFHDFKPKSLKIRTRRITTTIKKKYENKDINLKLLKEAFQSRYIVEARK